MFFSSISYGFFAKLEYKSKQVMLTSMLYKTKGAASLKFRAYHFIDKDFVLLAVGFCWATTTKFWMVFVIAHVTLSWNSLSYGASFISETAASLILFYVIGTQVLDKPG